MIECVQAKFLRPIPWPPRSVLEESLPSVTLIGRSNVGKSTLTGSLLGSTKLVRSSKTPGRTVDVIAFRCTWKNHHTGEKKDFHLFDTPGRGYAVQDKGTIQHLEDTLAAVYAEQPQGREPSILLSLLDIRRDLSAKDKELHGFLNASWSQLMLIATKTDKLSKSKQKPALAKLGKSVGAQCVASPFANPEAAGALRSLLWDALLS